MNGIKAIETTYKGHRFRSRLEARWAVFFDGLGLAWEYEKEGYELSVGRYLPDFWIPMPGHGGHENAGCFVEIKPDTPSTSEIDKAVALSVATKRNVFIAAGIPKETARIFKAYRTGDYWEVLSSVEDEMFRLCWFSFWLGSERSPYAAMNAATSAQFEFGKCGVAP